MINQLMLYADTIRKMKPGQIVARIKKVLGLKCSLGVKPAEWRGEWRSFKTADYLDFDPDFLSRFNVDGLLSGKITFLHETESFNWDQKWEIPERTPLWNFNLHYFEYLMAFVHAFEDTRNEKYLRAIETCISGWIEYNPQTSGGSGWAAYTISLRLVYWFSCLFHLSDVFNNDFKKRLLDSIYEQYIYLANHLEKDILANHYFEDLKAIILCAIAFQDEPMLQKALNEFKKQCKEQILPDGMHFELSPMYHKIMLEAILRVAVALRSINRKDQEIEHYIQKMTDVAYSFEDGLERIPLFNDGGNNIAKSLKALLKSANELEILPHFKTQLVDSGFYIYRWDNWKMIIDAGNPGPTYNAGHAHCDAMSYELFCNGKPLLVNCGTYAYQCKERSFFRNTSAHNTVMVEGVEQSDCWSIFRMGKCCRIKNVKANNEAVIIQMLDKNMNILKRTIKIYYDSIQITDESPGKTIVSYIHYLGAKLDVIKGRPKLMQFLYSEDYGKASKIEGYEISGDNTISYYIRL